MRKISTALQRRFDAVSRNRANNTDNGAILWVSRHHTALDSDVYLETELIRTVSGLSAASVAVRRLRSSREGDRIYAAYIGSGRARVVYANAAKAMEAHQWIDADFNEAASAVAIAFDGTMPKARNGRAEFVTEDRPWVFWVSGGKVFAEKLGGGETLTLANANATDVTAVRAMHSEVGGFDFGLVVFFILNGSIYYRQLIDGVWEDALPVNFGPSKTWVSVAASRTWDYRVALQARASDGTLWELFTQFMGVAKQNAEHIELRRVSAEGRLTAIRYHDMKNADEHISLRAAATAPYGGLYGIAVPSMLSARNIDDGTGDWGHVLEAVFDVHLRAESVAENATRFSFTDENGALYTASTASLGPDGRTATLRFTDFNPAVGACVLSYTPGTLISMADTVAGTCGCAFTPRNLVPPGGEPPAVLEVWNE